MKRAPIKFIVDKIGVYWAIRVDCYGPYGYVQCRHLPVDLKRLVVERYRIDESNAARFAFRTDAELAIAQLSILFSTFEDLQKGLYDKDQ